MCASHDILKKHDQLEFEEHNGINRGSTITCIGFLHELTHKREVEGAFQVTVEMILRDSFFQRDMDERSKMPLFAAHHVCENSLLGTLAGWHAIRMWKLAVGLAQPQ